MRHRRAVIDLALKTARHTDDKGDAGNIVIRRGSLGKEAMAAEKIAVVGRVHYRRIGGRGINDLSYKAVGI